MVQGLKRQVAFTHIITVGISCMFYTTSCVCLFLLNGKMYVNTPYMDAVLFPKQCGNTWGSYGSSKSRGG